MSEVSTLLNSERYLATDFLSNDVKRIMHTHLVNVRPISSNCIRKVQKLCFFNRVPSINLNKESTNKSLTVLAFDNFILLVVIY